MSQITVIGSINMDIVNRVEYLPLSGETVKAIKTEFNPGGKGANQAVAAARAGGKVRMAGAIGDDPFGKELKTALETAGIDADHVREKQGKSGLAFITVDSKGENNIILEEGANGRLAAEDIDPILTDIAGENTLVLLQNEIPWTTNATIIDQAARRQIPVYLNPAPARDIPVEILSKLTGLFVNEIEAERIAGFPITNEQSAKQAIGHLIDAGVREVILTLGEKGSYFADQSGTFLYTPALQVTAIDTTAAGDTFIGTYLVAKMSGKDNEASLQFAAAAASLTVRREGAQQSIPFQEEINRHLLME